jgi:signal peptidase I
MHFFQRVESRKVSTMALLIAVIGAICEVLTKYHPPFNELNWFYAAVFIATPVIFLMGIVVSTLLVHLIARTLKGEGTYYQILNSICYIGVLFIVFMPLQLIFSHTKLEYIRLVLSAVEGIWSIILHVKAVQAVYAFKLGKSISTWLLSIAANAVSVFLLVFGFVRPFIAQAYKAPSRSMSPTIDIGDRVLVEKLSYHFSSAKRGDVIVFKPPERAGRKQKFLKRIAAVGGDAIEIQGRNVYINGDLVDESKYVRHTTPASSIAHYFRDFGPVEVPEGHVFVMGDNRDKSADSRVWGPVPRRNVTGKVLLIYWSEYIKPKGSIRWSRIGRIIR